MGFDPLDHTTWYDDPEDFVVPPHEQQNVHKVDMEDVERRTFEDDVQREVLKQLRYEQGNTGIKQVTQGQEALSDALQTLDDAEAALRMTDEEMADELYRRDLIWREAIREAREVYRKYLDENEKEVS